MAAFEDKPDSALSYPLKVTLPQNVFDELSDYADANSMTKSDVIRDAVKEKLRYDEEWRDRIYVFKSLKQYDNADTLEVLHTAPKGSLIKIASHETDIPNIAQGLICNLVKYDKTHVYVEVPSRKLFSAVMDDDVSNIAMIEGTLIVPKLVEVEPMNLLSHRKRRYNLIYKLPLEYIWQIDENKSGRTI